MQRLSSLTLAVLLCAAVALAGCTGTQIPPGTTPSGTTVPTEPAAQATLVTSPTDVVPYQNAITITVKEKDYLGMIPVVFDGGTGQIHVKKIEVTLYRADGRITAATIGTNKEDSVELEGTKSTDRVVVYASFDNGQRLKVTDVLSPYRTR